MGISGSFRGIGAADMAYATRTGRPHRANGKIACHVVEVMQGIRVAAETGQSQDIESDLERPSPMPPGLRPGELDA